VNVCEQMDKEKKGKVKKRNRNTQVQKRSSVPVTHFNILTKVYFILLKLAIHTHTIPVKSLV